MGCGGSHFRRIDSSAAGARRQLYTAIRRRPEVDSQGHPTCLGAPPSSPDEWPHVHNRANVKLPRVSGYGFDLNRLVAACPVGGDDVVVRYIARERRRDEAAPADFDSNKVLADLLGQKVVTARGHCCPSYG
jgi:hypothetical protein